MDIWELDGEWSGWRVIEVPGLDAAEVFVPRVRLVLVRAGHVHGDVTAHARAHLVLGHHERPGALDHAGEVAASVLSWSLRGEVA